MYFLLPAKDTHAPEKGGYEKKKNKKKQNAVLNLLVLYCYQNVLVRLIPSSKRRILIIGGICTTAEERVRESNIEKD